MRGYYKSGICDTKPVISRNEAVWSQSYCRVSIETRVRHIDWWQMWWPTVNSSLLSGEHNFSTRDISHTFCGSVTKFGSVRGQANEHLLSEFGELWPTFSGQKFLTTDIWHGICQSTMKFGSVGGLANRNLFPEFRELWSGGPLLSVLHWCTCKVVFRQLSHVCR